MATLTPLADVGMVFDAEGQGTADWRPLGNVNLQFTIGGTPSRTIQPLATVSLVFDAEPAAGPTVAQIRDETGIEVRVFDVLTPNGNPLAVVPNPVNVSFEAVLNDVGSISVEVDTDDMPASVWAKDNIWKVYWLGLEVFAGIGEMVQDTQIQGNGIRQRVAAGKGIAQWLDKMKTYPGNWGGAGSPTESQTFSNVSLATIYETLLGQGFLRGVAPWMYLDNWNGIFDTAGVQWTDSWNLSIQAGTSMLELLQTYQQQLPLDWYMNSQGGLSLWHKAGVDQTTTIRVAPVGSVISAQVTTDNTNLWDVVLAEDANKGFTEQKSNAVIAVYGRREQFTSSSSVITATGRANLAFSLLQQWKVPVVEKLVQFDPSTVGQRPFIDYGLGDTIAVEFIDGTISPARVIAIAMNSGNASAPLVEVTLDFMLEKNNNTATGTSGTSTPTSGGEAIVYADNGSATLTITTGPTVFIILQLEAFNDTYAEVQTYLHLSGATAGAVLTADVYLDGSIIRTSKQTLPAGDTTFDPAFIVQGLSAGNHTVWLRLTLSTGTASVAPFDLQHWWTSPDINGGIGGVSPLISVADNIPFAAAIMPQNVSISKTLVTQTPTGITRTESLHPYQTVTDNDGSTNMIQLGYVEAVNLGANDGHTSSIPSFTATATQLEVGNDGGLIWSAFARFIIPSPGLPSGITITHAWLSGFVDQNDNNANVLVQAEHAAAPTAPTSRADYLSRTLTTASVVWTPGSVTSGQAIQSPDLASIIQELVTAFGGTITAINIFWQDNSSPLNGKMLIRSFENAANEPPVLTIRYHL
jgi:hypothetical protein